MLRGNPVLDGSGNYQFTNPDFSRSTQTVSGVAVPVTLYNPLVAGKPDVCRGDYSERGCFGAGSGFAEVLSSAECAAVWDAGVQLPDGDDAGVEYYECVDAVCAELWGDSAAW